MRIFFIPVKSTERDEPGWRNSKTWDPWDALARETIFCLEDPGPLNFPMLSMFHFPHFLWIFFWLSVLSDVVCHFQFFIITYLFRNCVWCFSNFPICSIFFQEPDSTNPPVPKPHRCSALPGETPTLAEDAATGGREGDHWTACHQGRGRP